MPLPYTLYYTEEQFARFWSYTQRTRCVQLIHILENDDVKSPDRYIVMVDCSPAQYTLLQML